MCGIVGWVDWERDLRSEKETLVKMTQKLTPRGPDDEGHWVSPHVAFGHRRLVVIDPEGGRQPMLRRQGENACVLAYNGELYNTEDLRRELSALGYSFRGHSDTEVLLTAYLAWGPASVERFNGIFAFAIWDEARERLFLARDRLGVKPLFYYEDGKRFLFASEIKALLANSQIRPRVDSQGLAEIFLIGPARTPGEGIYRGMHELKPGHLLFFSRQGLTTQPYWVLPNHAHRDDPETTVRKVRELFLDTVRRQLISDVPIGTLLSGGLDSTAITAVAAQVQAEEGKGALKTFSVDYVDNDKYFQANDFQPNPDAPWIERVVRLLRTEHHPSCFDTPELADALISAVQARDLPGMADIDSSLLLFCRDIKSQITVGLSGECADEVFGGYPWFHRAEALQATTFPWSLHTDNRLEVLSPELIQLLRPEEYLEYRYSQALAEIPPQEEDGTKKLTPEEKAREQRLREISYLTLTRFMPTLLDRKDRMSMATGLEIRVPFCDHRLVEYVWDIPWSIKMLAGREKGLLRQALAGLLPEDILWRKKSPYPKTHHPAYLKAVSTWLSRILADRSSPLLPLVNVPALRALIEISSTLPSGRPWFGQLMDTPQMFAFLIQVDSWLRTNKVEIV
ncbi:asparagine synthetase [glutamine-hydrolyzing] 3 [Peptococcaceae bacterium CEB3]|nr:asparagine synthetase [glutamine-hydrolyzing] 3 [Peptococcaceae bacterium CEB3]